MKGPVKILIVDDHQMFIDGIKALLNSQKKYKIVNEARNGIEALEAIDTNEIDIIITDLSMPEMDGIELIKKVKYDYPAIKILVLSMHNNRETISEILMSEAEGYILKNTGKHELLVALDRIHNNGTFYSHEVTSLMMDKIRYDKKSQQSIDHLTEREKEVLSLIVREYSSEEIAEKLFISKRTVDTHRINILKKTQSRTIVGLIKFAFLSGLIQNQNN